MNDPRGSLWRRWDLHVHTPSSLSHNYGADSDATWDRYISALEALPAEFAVIGINDYIFLDGYRKVLEYKSRGRLANISTFLPVLEFRIDKFGGTDSKLRRVNFHVIFSNELSSDQIDQQFLNQLRAKYTLSPGLDGSSWGGVITRDSLRDLGAKIIESAPPERRPEYGQPLIEGFNNLNLSLDNIHSALDSSYLRGRYITAVGKTEWASLKWNDQSIAEKKTIINGADLVFVAAESPDAYCKARAALSGQGVNSKLLDCSDAHDWADATIKDRIGRCDTWIKADATFRGLQHALLEFEDRVFVGSLPPKLAELKANQQRHICSLAVRKTPGSTLAEQWFQCDIPLNPGLVAVIGNKGSGKSALADIIALGCNSSQEANFSFLHQTKFRRPRDNKSEHFQGTIRWCSGESVEFPLSRSSDPSDVERVRYIPQSHLERLCNELSAENGGAFERELRAVIFSHIPVAERLEKPSLDTLLTYLSEGVVERLTELRSELAKINRDIAEIEQYLTPEHKKEVEKRLTARLRELDTHKANKPIEIPKPDADPATRQVIDDTQKALEQQRQAILQLEASVEAARQARKALLTQIATADKVIERVTNLETRHKDVARESEQDLKELGLRFEDMVQMTVDTAKLKTLKADLVKRETEARNQADQTRDGSDHHKLLRAREALVGLQNTLDTPTRRYQEYLTSLKQWEDAGQAIQDDKENPDSVASLKEELKRIASLPSQREALTGSRTSLSRKIFDKMAELKDHFRRLYRPVQEFIKGHKTLAESIDLSFDVRIGEQGFIEEVTGWLHQGRSGSFQGTEEGTNKLKALLQKHSFDSADGTEAFLTEFAQMLHNDSRNEPARQMSTKSQLKANKTVAEFYDFIFGLGYLKPRYALKMEGKEIFELSPGERGLLLLLFYLLVEKSDIPLLLDQPEENLDNETVHEVLVPSIRLAKRRRQIIIVTHNPNLAVVSDADQIVAASIDKKNGCRVTYESGALESPVANRFVVRYLEGTMPAFLNREQKYMKA